MIGLRIESTVLVWEDESVRVCVFACVYGCVFRVNVCVYVSCEVKPPLSAYTQTNRGGRTRKHAHTLPCTHAWTHTHSMTHR